LLQNHAAQTCGADIWVEKRIPSGAGLGGGSSDAASTLMGLNRLWGCGLSSIALQNLGLQLGADVPFFCSGWGAARGQGIGESLTPLSLEAGVFTVIYPACHVPTPTVFRHPDLTWRAKQAIIYASEEKHVNLFASNSFGNDLEQLATHIAPPIGHAIASLKAAGGAQMVRMSGSGSAVFAQYASVIARQTAWIALQSQWVNHWQAWQVNGLNKHPFVAHCA
jgi:4-diphosphocytidyl-2-C-methyl-D-erythritol kinase